MRSFFLTSAAGWPKTKASPSVGKSKPKRSLMVKHGGKIESVGHPTTTLEDLFLRIIEESKAHPGRRYMPEKDEAGKAVPAELRTHVKK